MMPFFNFIFLYKIDIIYFKFTVVIIGDRKLLSFIKLKWIKYANKNLKNIKYESFLSRKVY